MKKIVLLFFLQIIIVNAQDFESKEALDSITISGYGKNISIAEIPKTITILTAQDIKQKNIENLDDLLEEIAGIDIRTRGDKGVQSDISIRGGNFDQVLILLNGIPFNNPQTGHHTLDLPVDVSMIEKIEILEGASGQSFGVNAYSGAINIITKNPQTNQAETGIKIGQYGYLKTDWNISHTNDKISVFNGLTYQRSNGYLTKDSINNTDFFSIKDFLNIKIETKNHPVNIQLGYHQKDFGANSFYTSKYPWQYEKTKGFSGSISKKIGKKILWKPYLLYRLHFDEFQLFRESVYKYRDGYYISNQDTAQYAPGFYYRGPNYHKTQNIAGGIKTGFQSKYGKTNLHLMLKNEEIWSNVLGKPLDMPIEKKDGRIYTKYDQRFYTSIIVNQVKKWENYQVGAGINFLYNSQYKLYSSGGIFINHTGNKWTKYLSINSAVRLPTFTDLYYEGPSNTGNPDLKPEQSVTYETGIKYKSTGFSSNLSLFYRQGINTIDWIKTDPQEKWHTENLTNLNTYGMEFSAGKKFKPEYFVKKIAFSYAYLDMNKEENENLISKYALDYLKHKFTGEIIHKFFYGMETSWQLIYKQREGQYLDYINQEYQLFDYKPYFLTHLKMSKVYNHTSFELKIENLFDIEYRDLSYIKMPGRWIIFGITYHFDK